MSELIDDALRMVESCLPGDGVRIVRQHNTIRTEINVDRHKIVIPQ